MGLLTYSETLDAGTTAAAPEVQAMFNDVQALVNGSLDTANIAIGTGSGQIAAGNDARFIDTLFQNWVYDNTFTTVTAFLPFFVAVGSGRTLKLGAVTYVLAAGTATLKLQRATAAGGYSFAGLSGFTGMAASTTVATTDPADQALATRDALKLVCTADSSARGLSMLFEYEAG